MPELKVKLHPIFKVGMACSVHLFTASGVIAGFLALDSIMYANWKMAFLYMGVALLIDMVDGSMARAVKVKEIMPKFDGALLDNMIDYFNYVIIPAAIVYRAQLLPTGWELWGAVIISMASAFQFCNTEAKTEDHYFTGFPSYWNVTVIYLMVLDLGPEINLALIILLGISIFIPIKYIYPSRTTEFRKLNIALTVLWFLAIVAIVFLYPAPPDWLVSLSLIYVAYYFLISIYITIQKHRGIL